MKDLTEYIFQLTEGNNDFSDKSYSHYLDSTDPSFRESVTTNERVLETKWTTSSSRTFDELLLVIRMLGTGMKTVAHSYYARSVFTVADTSKELLDEGLLGEQFTIKYGTISRHNNKDKDHFLTEYEWGLLPSVLKSHSLKVYKYKGEDTFRIYTNIFRGKKTLVVGVSVKHSIHGKKYNVIKTLFFK